MEKRADEQRREQPRTSEAEREDRPAEGAPRKRHGDALIDGSGTRHGVQDADSRPAT